MAFLRRPGVLRGIGLLLGVAGVSNMVGLPWAFIGNDLTVRGMVINGILFIIPAFILMRTDEVLEK